MRLDEGYGGFLGNEWHTEYDSFKFHLLFQQRAGGMTGVGQLPSKCVCTYSTPYSYDLGGIRQPRRCFDDNAASRHFHPNFAG